MRHIFIQMWNKRRANAWIVLELILITFFLWGAIDPVYVLLSNRAIDSGYDVHNVFRLSIGQYPSTHSKYSEEQQPDSLRKIAFMRIYNQVRQYPGVESAVITKDNMYPLSESSSGGTLKRDTLTASGLTFRFYDEGEFFSVFRIREAGTGNIPDHRRLGVRSIYLTKDMAQELFPDADITGKSVYASYRGDTTYYQVAGVVPGFKFRSTYQPAPTAFMPSDDFALTDLPSSAQICFRIRDGLSAPAFAEQFKKEMSSRLAIGNLYFLQLTGFETIRRQSDFLDGVTNKLRLQTVMAIFFLICTFLGIVGTFWLRSDARKGEIGLRMALGGSRRTILKEFLLESWWLITIAWAIGVFFVLQRVHITGFAEPPYMANDAFIQNRFMPHFCIVSLIVYVLILLIAMWGTLIPAIRAASIYPSEALKEE